MGSEVKVKELVDGSEYDIPNDLVDPRLSAILRAIRGEVKILANYAMPIYTSIQEAIDDLRSHVTPVPKEVLEDVEKYRDPKTWEACINALKPLVVKMLKKKSPISMKEIRWEAERHPFLQKFPNSIGQRVRDLVKQRFLNHYVQGAKTIHGYYVS